MTFTRKPLHESVGNVYKRTGFLWLPKTCGHQTKWLEKATWYDVVSFCMGPGEDINFVPYVLSISFESICAEEEALKVSTEVIQKYNELDKQYRTGEAGS